MRAETVMTKGTVILAALLALGTGSAAQSAVIGFVNNPTGNAADFANHLAANGASVTTVIDFESHTLGSLNGGFYAAQGVTMSIASPFYQYVADVIGVPSGSTDCPCSFGEGPFPLSRALVYGDQVSLTVNFANAIAAIGLLTGDHYDPHGTDPISIEAFTGVNGTGTSLGSVQSFPRNYQLGYSYFMGLASTTNDIRSIVLTDGFSATSDGVYLDNFQIAMVGVPEPATLGVLAMGVVGMLGLRRRR
jgi:hypothetical protein